MRILKTAILLTLLHCTIFTIPAKACSAFLLKNSKNSLMCKSYDWDFGEGIVVINPRGEERISMPVIGGKTTFRWVSEYASITFNQYGQNLPNGGINEEGLAIEILVLNVSDYGSVKGYSCLNELQWIQYGLDNFKSVDDLIKGTEKIKVKHLYAKVHYFISDASGKSAVVEYINGKRVVTTGSKMPYNAITNSTYYSSVRGLKSAKGGCRRFKTIAAAVNKDYSAYSTTKLTDRGFTILNSVKSEKRTQWQIIYDLKAKKIQFRTKDNSNIREINISDFNLNSNADVMYASMKSDCKKDSFKKISKSINKYLLTNAFTKLKLQLPGVALNELVNYTTTAKPTEKLQTVVDMFDRIR
jgi:choloylglycine hydrolase